MQNVKELLAAMLTENTGAAMCDSGGAYGRNHERNKGKTVADFEREPAATLSIALNENGEVWDFSPAVHVFHALADRLELDALCSEFNSIPVKDWDCEKYYGVSEAGEAWLAAHGFTQDGETFNTYNWDNHFSQVVQGCFIRLGEAPNETDTNESGPLYVLLQVHGGCDVRGGYTDAKLFKVGCSYGDHQMESYEVLSDDCGFSVEWPDHDPSYMTADWSGEWINYEGQGMDDAEQVEFAKLAGCTPGGDSVTLHGDINHPY